MSARSQRRGLRALLPRSVGAEAGFTIVELVVALLVIGTGLLGAVAVIDRQREFVTSSEKRQAASHIAERTLEAALARPWAELALAGIPQSSNDSTSPGYYVSEAGYQWNPASSSREPFVTGGRLPPGPRKWRSGRLAGTVWRFVTWSDDPLTTEDLKRVTVAVTVDGVNGPHMPVTTSSLVSAP